jgi:hypothetical protein
MAGSSACRKEISGACTNAAALRCSGDETSVRDETRPALLLLALYVLAVFAPRLLVFPVSDIDWDESYTALIAQGLLQGQMPFDYVFGGHHSAASYYFYAPFLSVFGSGIIAIRSVALTYASAGFYLIYRICTSAGLEPRLSSVCAALYGVMTLPSWGLASNTELILNPLILSVTLACFGYGRAPTRTGAVLIGAISGVCVSVNYIVAPIVAMLGLCAIILVRRNMKAAVVDLSIAAASALGVFGMLLLPVILFGHIVAYFSEQIAFLKTYASLEINNPWAINTPWNNRLRRLFIGYCAFSILVPVIAAAPIFWFKGAKAAVSGREKMIFIYLGCYVAAAVLAAVAPWRFYPHYTLLVAPAIALMTGAVLRLSRGRHTLRYALALTAAIAVAQPIFVRETRWEFERGIEGWVHWLNHEPSDSLAEIAREVKRYTRSGDYIFVTYTHVLYFLSDTKSPTRFPYGGDMWVSEPAIMRMFGTTPAGELDRILAVHPKMIIVKVGVAPRDVDPEYLRKLAAALDSQYQYLRTIDHFQLYRLRAFVVNDPKSFLRTKPDPFAASSAHERGDVAGPWPYQGLLRESRRGQMRRSGALSRFPQLKTAYRPRNDSDRTCCNANELDWRKL